MRGVPHVAVNARLISSPATYSSYVLAERVRALAKGPHERSLVPQPRAGTHTDIIADAHTRTHAHANTTVHTNDEAEKENLGRARGVGVGGVAKRVEHGVGGRGGEGVGADVAQLMYVYFCFVWSCATCATCFTYVIWNVCNICNAAVSRSMSVCMCVYVCACVNMCVPCVRRVICVTPRCHVQCACVCMCLCVCVATGIVWVVCNFQRYAMMQCERACAVCVVSHLYICMYVCMYICMHVEFVCRVYRVAKTQRMSDLYR